MLSIKTCKTQNTSVTLQTFPREQLGDTRSRESIFPALEPLQMLNKLHDSSLLTGSDRQGTKDDVSPLHVA